MFPKFNGFISHIHLKKSQWKTFDKRKDTLKKGKVIGWNFCLWYSSRSFFSYCHLSQLVTSWGFPLPVQLETLDSVAVPNPVRSKAKTSSPLREANRAVLCSSLSLKMPSAPDKIASTCSIHVNLLSSKLSSRCFQSSCCGFQGRLAAVTSHSWRWFRTKSIVDWLRNSETQWKHFSLKLAERHVACPLQG